ncbi:MAG TPA: thrombospondin type 3 repeat-containing protein [Candidatus Paceibacterota bacterium]|nr:thrombospondin type 3 repeat-containing protein [Candidatus Paceibacterota bacterium]
MARSSGSSFWGICLSVLVSAGLIGGAYALAQHSASPRIAEASTETALLQAITSRDSDNDGLPDWEESLYGTDSQKADTRGLGMKDGEAVSKGLIVPKAVADVPVAAVESDDTVAGAPKGAPSGTLTDTFAKNFFTLYLSTKQSTGGATLTKDQVSRLVDRVFTQLTATLVATPDFKKKQDLVVRGLGAADLRAYAVTVEQILAVHSTKLPKSELLYLQDFLENKDASAIAHIQMLSKAYTETATGIAVLPVPQEVADTMLSLINAMARIGAIAADFARVDADPVAAMFALKQYTDSVQKLAAAFQSVNTLYAAQGVAFRRGEPGAAFVNVISAVKEREASSTPAITP